jgi:O-antigen ligase
MLFLLTGRRFRLIPLPDSLMVLLCVWLLIGVSYTPHTSLAIWKYLRFLASACATVYFGRLLIRSEEDISRVVLSFVAVASILGLFNLAGYIREGQFTSLHRVTIGLVSPVPLAGIMAMGLYACFVWLLLPDATRGLRQLVVCSLLLLIFALNLVLIGTRGAAIIAAVMAICLAVRLRSIGALVCIGVGVAAAWTLLTRDIIAVPLAYRLAIAGTDPSVLDRLEMLRFAYQQAQHSPFIGLGTASFSWLHFVYPHNIFVEIAVENGVIGLAVFLTWLVCCLRGRFLPVSPAGTSSGVGFG